MQYVAYIFILFCLIVTFFLYNEQLASIPLLVLSFFLFCVSMKEFRKIKNGK